MVAIGHFTNLRRSGNMNMVNLTNPLRLLQSVVGADSSPVDKAFSGTRLSACNLCEAICGLEFTFDNGNVKSVRGNASDPLSRGHICPKGVAMLDIYNDSDRLRRPVRRVGEGPDAQWVEMEWDAAIELVATRLAETINARGRDAVGVYLGNPNVHSVGAATHGIEFAKLLRTHNLFSASSVDQLPHQFVSWQLYGHQLLIPVPDIDRSSYLLVFGANPMASNGSLWTVPDFPNRLRHMRKRGGRLVVVDPRRTETAKVADEHHFIRPGADAAVLLAMLNVLFADELVQTANYVRGVDDVRDLVASVTPELAEQASGIAAQEIRRLTHEFAQASAAAAYGRIGVSTQGNGSLAQWAIQCLNILTGNLDREGGVLFPEPAIDLVKLGLLGRGHYGKWRSRVRGLPEFGGELPSAALAEEIDTPGDGQIRAMVTVAGNPVSSTPNGGRLDLALNGLDFMVSVDFYINETTRHADVILPPTSALERDQYDLIFHNFGVRNTARFVPAMFAKPAGTKHDWEIFRDLALGLIGKLRKRPPLRARLELEARLRVSPTVAVAALLAAGRRTNMAALRSTPEGVDFGPLRSTLPDRLSTRDKRIDLLPNIIATEARRYIGELSQLPEAGLTLIGRRHQRDCNSWLHNADRLTKGIARHHLLMNPSDLDSYGISDGSTVRVTSAVGSVEVDVAGSADVMRGVVSLPHGYGHRRDGVRLTQAIRLPGVSINDLTDPDRLDVSGNAALSGVPVTVEMVKA